MRKKLRALLCVGVYFLSPQSVQAEDLGGDIHFRVKPASCVALHKGQLCYQSLRFQWEVENNRHYCIYSDTNDLMLFCAASDSKEYVHEYVSKTSESFSLRLRDSGTVVATLIVNTAWVYRTGKRSSSGWRLF